MAGDQLEQWLEREGALVDPGADIAQLRVPVGHGAQREVGELGIGNLVPRERARSPSPPGVGRTE